MVQAYNGAVRGALRALPNGLVEEPDGQDAGPRAAVIGAARRWCGCPRNGKETSMHEREGGWTEQHPELQASPGSNVSQESFLGSFSRVPSGLDPTQVYSYFLKLSARIQQLEEQAKRVSAPFILEAAMREAT